MPKITAVPKPQEYLSPRKAAELLDVHYNTMLKWCLAGKVGVRVGKRWRILEAELPKVAAGWAGVPNVQHVEGGTNAGRG